MRGGHEFDGLVKTLAAEILAPIGVRQRPSVLLASITRPNRPTAPRSDCSPDALARDQWLKSQTISGCVIGCQAVFLTEHVMRALEQKYSTTFANDEKLKEGGET